MKLLISRILCWFTASLLGHGANPIPHTYPSEILRGLPGFVGKDKWRRSMQPTDRNFDKSWSSSSWIYHPFHFSHLQSMIANLLKDSMILRFKKRGRQGACGSLEPCSRLSHMAHQPSPSKTARVWKMRFQVLFFAGYLKIKKMF